jgi:hypothetical protein
MVSRNGRKTKRVAHLPIGTAQIADLNPDYCVLIHAAA